MLLQWALFALCLHATGVGANPAAVFAAFAVERALTLAVVTPAGTGIAEAATTGLLIALGFDPAASAAGVVLYRLFVFLAEIPVGAVVVGAWWSNRFVRTNRAEAAASSTAAIASSEAAPNARAPKPQAVTVSPGSGGEPRRQADSGADVTQSPTPSTIIPPTASRR